MILTDDNFASIVNAVEEGRAVYNNIRKFAIYIFNSNMPEAVPFILYLFSRGTIPLPLTIMQVLSIDLGTDMVPAIGLGTELPEEGIMDRPPRSQKESLLNRNVVIRAFFWYGILGSFAAIASYFFLNWEHGWPNLPLAAEGTVIYRMATAMALGAIVFSQIGIVFNCRTERLSIFKKGFTTNKMVLVGIAVELTLLCILIYAPFLHNLFNTAPIGMREWGFLFLWAPFVFLIDELRKLFLRKRDKMRMKSREVLK
jgi:magnesium-transporting ATPase (P-type)